MQAERLIPERLEGHLGEVVTWRAAGGRSLRLEGIEPGDILTRAGGIAVRDLHHFHEALKGRKSGQELEVEMLRAGDLLTVRPILREES